MVKKEIIKKVSEKIHRKLKKSDLKKILEIFLNTIIQGIAENRSCEFRSFGTWRAKKIKARMVRDPRTNRRFMKKESVSIAFKMSKRLQKKINNEEIIN